MYLNELVFTSGHYIPLKKELYNSTIHKLPIISHISFRDTDIHIATNPTKFQTSKKYENLQSIYSNYIEESEYCKYIRSSLFQKFYLYLKDNNELFDLVKQCKNHPIKLRPHKFKEIYTLLYKPLSKLVKLVSENYKYSYSDEESDVVYIYNTTKLTNKQLFDKTLYLFIELLIIYSYIDYERFLQMDINLLTIQKNLSMDEILLSYQDIRNESYLQYFIRYSQYIRNVALYNEGLTKSKILQLQKLKDTNHKSSEFKKQYPQIVRTMFGRNLAFIKYESDTLSEIDVIVEILNEIISIEQEITSEKIQSILNCEENYKLKKEDLFSLSEIFEIGFCLISRNEIRIKHDIHLCIHKRSMRPIINDIPLVLLYQTNSELFHIMKNESVTCLIGELTTKAFKDELDKIDFTN